MTSVVLLLGGFNLLFIIADTHKLHSLLRKDYVFRVAITPAKKLMTGF